MPGENKPHKDSLRLKFVAKDNYEPTVGYCRDCHFGRFGRVCGIKYLRRNAFVVGRSCLIRAPFLIGKSTYVGDSASLRTLRLQLGGGVDGQPFKHRADGVRLEQGLAAAVAS